MRTEGYGFWLHSGALAAAEMGGALRVESGGLGMGATFMLELPAPCRRQDLPDLGVRKDPDGLSPGDYIFSPVKIR